MAKWDEIKSDWGTTKITLAELAEKHDIKLGTLKSRKSREGGSRDPMKKDAAKNKGAPIGNSNGKGNRSRKHAASPKRNSNALKYGFYAQHLPEEFLEIMNGARQANPLDLIGEQIVIQYTAIIRAQK